jgi:hypothetical protein
MKRLFQILLRAWCFLRGYHVWLADRVHPRLHPALWFISETAGRDSTCKTCGKLALCYERHERLVQELERHANEFEARRAKAV